VQADLRTICRRCAYRRYDRSGRRPRVTPANTTAAAEKGRRGPRREKETSASTSPTYQRRRATVATAAAWRTVTAAAAAVASARRPQPSPLPRRAFCVYLHVPTLLLLLLYTARHDAHVVIVMLLLLLFFALLYRTTRTIRILFVIYITHCFDIVAQYRYITHSWSSARVDLVHAYRYT